MKLRLKDEKTGDLYDVDELSAKKVPVDYSDWVKLENNDIKIEGNLVHIKDADDGEFVVFEDCDIDELVLHLRRVKNQMEGK